MYKSTLTKRIGLTVCLAVVLVPLPTQVATFLSRTRGVATPSALYVIEMGGNDLRDALTVAAMGLNPMTVLDEAIASIKANIRTLYQQGAREFLVWTAPNIGTAPATVMLGASTSSAATQLSAYFNFRLQQKLDTLRAELAGSYFGVFDSFGIVNGIVAAPQNYGLTNVNTACVALNEPFTCRNPGDCLFWDGIHPTKAGPAILAQMPTFSRAPPSNRIELQFSYMTHCDI